MAQFLGLNSSFSVEKQKFNQEKCCLKVSFSTEQYDDKQATLAGKIQQICP